MYQWLWETSLYQKWLISFILICNIFGTIYGYHWYSSQLANTPNYFKLFVPDSPTATLFYVYHYYSYYLISVMP